MIVDYIGLKPNHKHIYMQVNITIESIINKHKMIHHRNPDTKTDNRDHIRTSALERSVMNNWGA